MDIAIYCDARVSASEDIECACGAPDGDPGLFGNLVAGLVGDALDRLVAVGRAAAISDNTRKAYQTGWRSWHQWATQQEVAVFPAASGDLLRWLAEMSADGKKPSTLRAYRSAVAHRHSRSPGPNPARSWEVSQLLDGLSRRAAGRGSAPRQAAPLRQHHVELITATADIPRCNQPGGRKETLRQARRRAVVDVAMIALAHDALLRCGELLALTWADIDLPADGGCGTVLIRRSKTDQHGHGAVAPISEFTCAALSRLRPAEARPGNPVFNLSPNTVARRFKAAAKAASIDPADISTHSPRVGMAQDLAAAGVDIAGIMLAGRWKTAATAARYIQHLAAHHTPAAQHLAGVSTVHGECSALVPAEAEHREVGVERDSVVYAQPLHDRPTCAVYQRESLTGEVPVDARRDLEIGNDRRLHAGDAQPDPIHELLGNLDSQAPRGQEPLLDQNVVTGQQSARKLLQPPRRAVVAGIIDIGRGVPGRRVHIDGHRPPWNAATASATADWPSAAMSLPPERPMPIIAETSALVLPPARSWSTKRRMYSAMVIPRDDAFCFTSACCSASNAI